MSKSVKRVKAAIDAAGIATTIKEMVDGTRTAADAASALGCDVDQIAKSVIFRGEDDHRAFLFLTAGGNRVDPARAEQAAGVPLAPADAAFVRRVTGFVIGGVSPIGHLSAPKAFFDPKLLEFPIVWAAAGTPRHLFSSTPQDLMRAASAQPTDFAT